jgi:antirestriction protein ArdC
MARTAGYRTPPRFLTLRQALELGGNVRKGEHGTKVNFVKQLQVRDQDADDSASTRLVPMMREYTVFNVEQCQNLPDSVKKPMRVRNPTVRDALADAFLQSTGAEIREGSEAHYVPNRDFISRSSTSTRGPAPASKCSTPTARWRGSAGVVQVGFTGRAGVAFQQMACLLGRSLRATLHIATR